VAYSDGKVILTSQGSHMHVIDSRTGRQRLDYDTGRGRRAPAAPSVQGNIIYFGSYGGRVWAIDLQSKTRPWDRPILFWKANLYVWGINGSPPVQRGSVWAVDIGGDVTRALAIAHDTVFATNSQGKVVALNTTTGAERWSTLLEYKITAAPTVAGDTVLIGTEAGIVFGLDARTGAILWQFQTGGEITGSPIAAGGTIYIASNDGKLYALTGSVSGSQ
jgi:outer membrane protein assembly factor BamB